MKTHFFKFSGRHLPMFGLAWLAPCNCARHLSTLVTFNGINGAKLQATSCLAGSFRLLRLVLYLVILNSALCLRALGPSYSVDWYKISGGGGTSTGGTYLVNGTIGQPDAIGTLSGGNYSLTGGFWSLISVVQTAGLPTLNISHSGNTVTVSWPNTGSYTLQQNANLASANGWTTSGYSISTANGTNSITIMAPAGNLFFRLSNP